MRKLIRMLLSLLILVLVSTQAWAAEKKAALQDVVSALEKGYASLQDVQADFAQKTVIAGVNREQKGSGELLLKKPASATAMFRFNYLKPKQQIVSNGKQVWFYLPENKQVMVSSVTDMFKGGNSIALNYLTGLGHVSRDFNVSFAQEPQDKNGNYQLELLPKKPVRRSGETAADRLGRSRGAVSAGWQRAGYLSGAGLGHPRCRRQPDPHRVQPRQGQQGAG